jgi:oxygen-independent coproporphyrinogen-3 oxidase
VDILQRFNDQFASLAAEGHLSQADEKSVSLSRQGLLRVDALLPRFFLPRHTGIRYT